MLKDCQNSRSQRSASSQLVARWATILRRRSALRFSSDISGILPEPEPEDKERCIAFFGDRCAYCGDKIKKGKGDLDHLVSAALGGRNHISNRVLSCKPCNANEKRDKHWEEFLTEKASSRRVFHVRRKRIQDWISEAGMVPALPEAVLRVLEDESEKATAAYDEACRSVRGAQAGIRPPAVTPKGTEGAGTSTGDGNGEPWT